jgi:hypothetical protein
VPVVVAHPAAGEVAGSRCATATGEGHVGFDNRLTGEQIAALAPGDAVVIKSG